MPATRDWPISGLTALTTVDRLRVAENPGMTSVAGLENLTALTDLFIVANPALTSVAALTLGQGGNLAQVSAFIRITDNAALLTCAARAVRDVMPQPSTFWCFTGDAADACSDDPDLCQAP